MWKVGQRKQPKPVEQNKILITTNLSIHNCTLFNKYLSNFNMTILNSKNQCSISLYIIAAKWAIVNNAIYNHIITVTYILYIDKNSKMSNCYTYNIQWYYNCYLLGHWYQHLFQWVALQFLNDHSQTHTSMQSFSIYLE